MTGQQFRDEVGGLVQVPNPEKNAQEDIEENKSNDSDDFVEGIGDLDKFKEIVRSLKVLARSTPSDKYLLVTGLRQAGEVVAVTGDGTNDAPALRKADVGFSMNLTGTDIAKASSDIILLDDDFSSITVALLYGRNVYDNVRKFIQFQLQVSIVAMVLVLIGSAILKDSPLNAVQMLWVNLIIDTFAALALATEPPQSKILFRKPQSRDAAIVTPVMWRNVFGHSVYQVSVLVLLCFFAYSHNFLVYDYATSCL